MTDSAGGLQDPNKVLQQQSAHFAEIIAKAQADMAAQVAQFQQVVDAAKETFVKPKPEVKELDGGLWFNQDAVKMLNQTLEIIADNLEQMSGQE